MNNRWDAFVAENEAHALVLTLDQRNLISDANQHINWLVSCKRQNEEEIARLRNQIAAAPELLAACKTLGSFIRDLLKLVSSEQIKAAGLERKMLRASEQGYKAIAKAKGGKP